MATICGTDPKTGKKGVIYAIHIPKGDVPEIMEHAKAEGWTELTPIWNPESQLREPSESSESDDSTTEKKHSSATSVAASPASGTPSRTSPQRARRKRS